MSRVDFWIPVKCLEEIAFKPEKSDRNSQSANEKDSITIYFGNWSMELSVSGYSNDILSLTFKRTACWDCIFYWKMKELKDNIRATGQQLPATLFQLKAKLTNGGNLCKDFQIHFRNILLYFTFVREGIYPSKCRVKEVIFPIFLFCIRRQGYLVSYRAWIRKSWNMVVFPPNLLPRKLSSVQVKGEESFARGVIGI